MGKQAIEIAKKHIQRTNPSLWNGKDKRPADVDSRIVTYPINRDVELDISFEYEEGDGWLHLCELRDRKTEELVNIMHGYGINSPQNLADTIDDICGGRLECTDSVPLQSQDHFDGAMNESSVPNLGGC